MPDKTGDNRDPRQEKESGSIDPSDIFAQIDREVGTTGSEDASDQLRRRYSIIESLLQVSASINSTLNLEQLLHRVVDAVVQITDCNRGYLMLQNESGKLALALARSKSGAALDTAFDRSLSVIRKAADTGEPQFVANAQEEADLRDKRSILDLNIRTVICLPLKFEDNLVGVIYADSDHVSARFAPQDVSILNAFGAQAAVAIENARQLGELEFLKAALERQNVELREQLAQRYRFAGIIGKSQLMQQVFEVITKVAPLSTTVLIQGETGTGKELIAKAIHYNGSRKDRPIVSVNCGALPRDILESELFGYRKGAFTGADEDRAGLFEAASGGTLFLDEIGEMPVELQVKLLRVLQEGEIRRLGEDQSRAVDVRIIAATNRDLEREVQRGTFRQDLFFRLNVVPLVLPALRERQEDILPLAEFFVDKFAEQMDRRRPLLTRRAKEMLLHHSWAGNVRELENAIERAMALAESGGSLDVDSFEHLVKEAGATPGHETDMALRKMMETWEREYLRKTLIRNDWNVSRTSNVLQISRQQLHNKIRKYRLTPPV